MALVQQLPEKGEKGSVLAANGWLTSAGVFSAALIFYLMKIQLGIDAGTMFWIIGAITVAGTSYAVWLVSDSLESSCYGH